MSVIKDRSNSAPHAVDIHVGRRMCERRLSLGYNQSDLGRAMGLTFQQIQKYEKGVNRISASKLWQAADFLNVPVHYFFEGLAEYGANAETAGAAREPSTRLSIEIGQLAPRLSITQQKLTLGLIRQFSGEV